MCVYLQLSDSCLAHRRADRFDGRLETIEKLREIAGGILVLLLLLQDEPSERHAVRIESSLGHFLWKTRLMRLEINKNNLLFLSTGSEERIMLFVATARD